jgi:hypothetical protein
MQVLVRVDTHQRASQAYDAQIPPIKLMHEMQNCRGRVASLSVTDRGLKKENHCTHHALVKDLDEFVSSRLYCL